MRRSVGAEEERERLMRSVSVLAVSSALVAVGVVMTRGGESLSRRRPAELLSLRGPEARPAFHLAKKRSLIATAQGSSSRGREEQLVSMEGSTKSKSEGARCVGLLHSCQSWLELKDGEVNSIVITSPDDDTLKLIDKNITLPASGKPIGGNVWKVLQESCKYGLADLSTCDKPPHWPQCTGSMCR
jgi:hypothetical protein